MKAERRLTMRDLLPVPISWHVIRERDDSQFDLFTSLTFGNQTMHNFVRPMQFDDGGAVIEIYREGIGTGNATFRTEVPTFEEWNQNHLPNCRYVAEYEGVVRGWAALAAVSSREVYRGVAEISIYVSATAQGMGIGSMLIDALIAEAERSGFWTLQARIFPENTGSLILHNRAGFREVGRREKLGQLAGQWRDLILLERRSTINGVT